MAEATGLAFAIPGLFTTGVQCFEWVRLARDFEKDYATSSVQLQLVQLRLLRWGEAVGLRYNSVSSSESISNFSDHDLQCISATLVQIQQEFARAESIAARSKSGLPNTTETPSWNALEYSPRPDLLDHPHQVLRKFTDTVISKYKDLNTAGHKIAGRTSWALNRRDHFNALISRVTVLVKDLEDLFPAVRTRELELGRREVSNAAPGDYPLLLDALGDQDEILKEAIGFESEAQGLTFDRITIQGEAKTHLGQIYNQQVVEKSGSKYTNMIIGGKSTSHLGNVYGTENKNSPDVAR